jgi:16S rRNA (guanine(966)-N(2))-methyltransferase RsmD
MRIIAGTKRGMKLFSPGAMDSRPITDRVKESLFDVLRNYGLPDGAVAADLFCGVGSLGLEALSRGAEFVTFIERQPKVIVILKRNIEKAGFVKDCKVIRADAFKAGAPVDCERQRYKLVFVDPPYAFTEDVGVGSPLGRLLGLLQEQVADDGLVVVRTGHRTTLADRYGRFGVIERRRWGTMMVSILRKSEKEIQNPKH